MRVKFLTIENKEDPDIGSNLNVPTTVHIIPIYMIIIILEIWICSFAYDKYS